MAIIYPVMNITQRNVQLLTTILAIASSSFGEVGADNPMPEGYKPGGWVRSRHAREIKSSNWSVGGEVQDRDYAIYNNYRQFLGPLGVKKIRLQGGWAKCEKTPGVYDFKWLDEVVNDALAQGVEPWIELSYGNAIYPGGGGTNLAGGLPTSPEALAAWDKWTEAMVKRFKDRVKEWEIWNEPDLHASAGAAVYADFYIRTARIVRREQPEARLLALALANIRDTAYVSDFLGRLKQQGALDLVNQITVHGYPMNPDDAHPAHENMRKVVRSYSFNISLRQGESGAPSTRGTVGALSKFPGSEITQAKWDLRRMLGDLGHDLESSVFTIIDFSYTTGSNKGLNTKGLLKANPDKTVDRPKQAYYAVQHLTAIFDHSLERITDLNYKAATTNQLAVFGFRQVQSGQHLVAFWNKEDVPADSNEKGRVDFIFGSAKFSEPVCVDLRTGKVYVLPEDSWDSVGARYLFRRLPVYDSPMLIADRSLIPLEPGGNSQP